MEQPKMSNLNEHKSIIRQSISEFLLNLFSDDELREILSGKVKKFNSFCNLLTDTLILELEKIRSEKNASSYVDAFHSDKICDQKKLAALIRASVIGCWSNLTDDAFEGIQENEDGSIREDFASFIAEKISDFFKMQPDSRYMDYLEEEKRANSLSWYWFDGFVICIKLSIIFIIADISSKAILMIIGSFVAFIGSFVMAIEYYNVIVILWMFSLPAIVFLVPLLVNFLFTFLGFKTVRRKS